MTIRLWRSLLAIFGICAIAWAVNASQAYPKKALLEEASKRVLSGDRFNAAQLSAMKSLLDAAPVSSLRASEPSNAAVVRLLLLDDAQKTGKQAPASDIVELQTVVAAAIDQSPSNSFMWLTYLWLKQLHGEYTQADLSLLRMSYWSGPHEAWIAIRRNSLATSIFSSLPNDIAEQVLSEFADLVRSHLYAAAVNILAGPGWPIRELLLGRLVQVGEADRRAFAKAIALKDLDGVAVPGVQEQPSRPF
jgi:hypothetical protein